MIDQINPDCDLEVDGGVDAVTAPMAVAAGANVLVAGTSVFGTDKSVGAAMESLRNSVMQSNTVNQTTFLEGESLCNLE